MPVPLSESRIAQKEGRYAEANMNFFSTPSLGIFNFQLPLSGSSPSPKLSTPSLGIRDFSIYFRMLSTPSLGITEPDSGRLSAAFCRGAPSHK
jgi:hypothetical protein